MGACFLYGNGGVGTGATLTVTAPAGATVTVSKDGKTKTKTADDSGVAVFKGMETGTWTVTISDGTQTSSKTVTITADYAVSIAFFAATINVTYPAGSTCTATDGANTLTAPDTSGTWACVVPNAGAWTVTCTNGPSTATASVSITTDGDSKSVTLAYALPYFYNAGDFTVKWLGSGSNSGGVLTVSGGSASAGTFEGYFVIPDIHNYKTISCYISSYTNVKPTVSIRNISTGTNVASAKPSSSGSTVRIDVSSLSGNGYYFVLSTNSTWEDEWVISNVKTTKIWGDAR